MRATRSRRSWGRGAETAAGRAAGPVLVAVSELPGLLIYITAGAVVPAAAGVWSNDVAYHRTITRRRGAANIWTAPDSLEVVTSGKVGVHGIEKAHPAELRGRAAPADGVMVGEKLRGRDWNEPTMAVDSTTAAALSGGSPDDFAAAAASPATSVFALWPEHQLGVADLDHAPVQAVPDVPAHPGLSGSSISGTACRRTSHSGYRRQ